MIRKIGMAIILTLISFVIVQGRETNQKAVTVAIMFDHNRMLVEAEIQRKDGTWRKARLWVDSGSPDFFISESLARDLGIDLSLAEDTAFKSANLDFETPLNVRIGGKNLDFEGIKSKVKFQPYWLFSTMQTDGNLPSTLLKKYHIVFDYPNKQLTIAEPGILKVQGVSSPITIHPQTGIVQMDAVIEGEIFCFAIDMGASYSFISEAKLNTLIESHPQWAKVTGTLGCSNMWGWWPANEQQFRVVRIPEIKWGNIRLENTGIAGVTDFSPNGPTLGEWYSQKTVYPVDGFLGANAIKEFRVEIDYLNSTIYFEKSTKNAQPEMDMVGISIRQLADGCYQVLGIVMTEGKPAVDGIEPDDIIIGIDGINITGKTMGTVVDLLRGKPGNKKKILLNRNGIEVTVETTIRHFL